MKLTTWCLLCVSGDALRSRQGQTLQTTTDGIFDIFSDAGKAIAGVATDAYDGAKDVTTDFSDGVVIAANAVADTAKDGYTGVKDFIHVVDLVSGHSDSNLLRATWDTIEEDFKVAAKDFAKDLETILQEVVCGSWGDSFFQAIVQDITETTCVVALDAALCTATDGAACVDSFADFVSKVGEAINAGYLDAMITNAINNFFAYFDKVTGASIPTCFTEFVVAKFEGNPFSPAGVVCSLTQTCLCSKNCGNCV